MAPRVIGAGLGLLAFSVSILFGLWARNPALVILERSLWAMVIFCAFGLAIGAAVNVVVREHVKSREAVLFPDEDETGPAIETMETLDATSTDGRPKPMDS